MILVKQTIILKGPVTSPVTCLLELYCLFVFFPRVAGPAGARFTAGGEMPCQGPLSEWPHARQEKLTSSGRGSPCPSSESLSHAAVQDIFCSG